MAKMFDKLKVQLSDVELLELGKVLADKDLLFKKIEDEQKEKNADYNERKTKLWTEIQELAEQRKQKVRDQDVEVREEPDDGRNTVAIVRIDNGQTVRTRPMSLLEIAEARQRRQPRLPIAQETAAVTPKKPDGQKVVPLDRSKKKGKKSKDALDGAERLPEDNGDG